MTKTDPTTNHQRTLMNLHTTEVLPMAIHPDTDAVLSAITAALEWATNELRTRGYRGVECRPQNVGPFSIFVCANSVDGHDWSTVSVQRITTMCMQGAAFGELPTRQWVSTALYAVSAPLAVPA
jgi:hypothetical protein